MKKIIIVGGGIVGASTAYELARKGHEVIVIDSHEPGRATSAAAGIICPWLSQRRNKAWYELARKSAAHYGPLIENLSNEGEIETGYKQVGVLRLLTDEARVDKLYKIAMDRRIESPEIGEVTKLNQAETQAKFPLLNETYYSLHISGAARVDGRLLRTALLKAASYYNYTFIQGKAALLHNKNTVTGVDVNGEQIFADTVIAANGVWMNDLLAPLNLPITFEMRKGQLIHLHHETHPDDTLPIVMALRNQYIIPFADGKIVIGSTSEHPEYLDTRVTASGLQSILNLALETAPGLESSEFVEARTGFRPYTSDFLPVFGRVPNVNGLLLANGLGASGLTTGPFIGRQLAKLASEEELDLDITDYAV